MSTIYHGELRTKFAKIGKSLGDLIMQQPIVMHDRVLGLFRKDVISSQWNNVKEACHLRTVYSRMRILFEDVNRSAWSVACWRAQFTIYKSKKVNIRNLVSVSR